MGHSKRSKHNHPTRDIKPEGSGCPGCDDYHALVRSRKGTEPMVAITQAKCLGCDTFIDTGEHDEACPLKEGRLPQEVPVVRTTTREPMDEGEWLQLAEVLHDAFWGEPRQSWATVPDSIKAKWVRAAKAASMLFEDVDGVE